MSAVEHEKAVGSGVVAPCAIVQLGARYRVTSVGSGVLSLDLPGLVVESAWMTSAEYVILVLDNGLQLVHSSVDHAVTGDVRGVVTRVHLQPRSAFNQHDITIYTECGQLCVQTGIPNSPRAVLSDDDCAIYVDRELLNLSGTWRQL